MLITFPHLISTASALPTDASALEKAISDLTKAVTALDSRSKFWESAMPWFTALVVTGLLGDLVVIFWERREEVHANLRWIRLGFNPAELSSRWRFALELFSTTAIFLGVGLELWAGVEIASINGQLRTDNGQLRDASNQLVTLIHSEGEDAKLARVKIEADVAWRRLSDEQKRVMAQHLRPHSLVQISVFFFPGDAEGSNFAVDIAEMFRMANPKNVFPPRPVQMPVGTQQTVRVTDSLEPWATGVEITSTKDSPSKSLADAIKKELNDRGFDAETIESNAPASLAQQIGPNVIVQVAARPNGAQGEAKLRVQAEKKTRIHSNHDLR